MMNKRCTGNPTHLAIKTDLYLVLESVTATFFFYLIYIWSYFYYIYIDTGFNYPELIFKLSKRKESRNTLERDIQVTELPDVPKLQIRFGTDLMN